MALAAPKIAAPRLAITAAEAMRLANFPAIRRELSDALVRRPIQADVTPNYVRFRLKNPGDFHPALFATIGVGKKGTLLVIGTPKSKIAKSAMLSSFLRRMGWTGRGWSRPLSMMERRSMIYQLRSAKVIGGSETQSVLVPRSRVEAAAARFRGVRKTGTNPIVSADSLLVTPKETIRDHDGKILVKRGRQYFAHIADTGTGAYLQVSRGDLPPVTLLTSHFELIAAPTRSSTRKKRGAYVRGSAYFHSPTAAKTYRAFKRHSEMVLEKWRRAGRPKGGPPEAKTVYDYNPGQLEKLQRDRERILRVLHRPMKTRVFQQLVRELDRINRGIRRLRSRAYSTSPTQFSFNMKKETNPLTRREQADILREARQSDQYIREYKALPRSVDRDRNLQFERGVYSGLSTATRIGQGRDAYRLMDRISRKRAAELSPGLMNPQPLRRMRDLYRTIYHRDGTVTVWDVYMQKWLRTRRPSDEILASLRPEDRVRVMRHCGIELGMKNPTLRAEGITLDGGSVKSPSFHYTKKTHLKAHARAMRWIGKQGGGSFEIKTGRVKRPALKTMREWGMRSRPRRNPILATLGINMNPGGIRIPFRHGQKVAVSAVRKWLASIPDPATRRALVERFEANIKQYRRFHLGSEPKYFTYQSIPLGTSRAVTDVDFVTSEGKEWAAPYQVPPHSKKFTRDTQGRYLHAHGESGIDIKEIKRPANPSKLPERFHTADGKFVGVVPSKNVKIREWYKGN